MPEIHNIVFPLSIGFGARGGPSRITEIATAKNGFENRNSPAAHSRRRYDIGAGVKSLDDLYVLLSFFEARFGQLYGFLFKDPIDHKSCKPSQTSSATDQLIGYGDDVTTRFLLRKSYSDVAGQYVRPIAFPNLETLQCAMNGQLIEFEFDPQTSEIVFDAAPALGAHITAGFEYYTPVRFDAPHLDISLESFDAGQAISVPIIEVITHDE